MKLKVPDISNLTRVELESAYAELYKQFSIRADLIYKLYSLLQDLEEARNNLVSKAIKESNKFS